MRLSKGYSQSNTLTNTPIMSHSPKQRDSNQEMELDEEVISNEDEKSPMPASTKNLKTYQPPQRIGTGYPSIHVTKDDILVAVGSSKRYTSGGLQQITPWHLKRAMLAASDDDCATKAALLATRWGRGDFSTSLGELVAESKLIALFKDERRIDVRPISVGCSMRRLLTKAYCSRTRARIKAIVEETQLGVLKGGYEIGVHAMRSLYSSAQRNGMAILLLDYANSFNTVDRNLMISLAAKLCPELANLKWWLYKLQSRVVTTRSDVIRSSSGTQQGCRLSNPLFALTMEFIAKKL